MVKNSKSVSLLAIFLFTNLSSLPHDLSPIFPFAFCSSPPSFSPDERPGGPREWGFRPSEGSVCALNPPAFVVRPQRGAEIYEFLLSQDPAFQRVSYRAKSRWFCHCPPKALPLGRWFWRFRFKRDGKWSRLSRIRSFRVTESSVVFPMPPKEELIRRVPRSHPRLFMRPEEIPHLKRYASGEGRDAWRRLLNEAEKILENPPPTEEPPRYPPGVKPLSDEWRKIWWGNRIYTIRVLGSAALLGFVWRIGGEKKYGELGKKLLLEASKWDPHGSTGYRYNDEAGMPYAYHFSRAYTFLYPLLKEKERRKCREVMRERGEEMFRHLCPRHLWRPYSSHSNRAWHFLGEVAIAFLREIPEAEEWLQFAVTVFFHCYPVWSDEDGGWHEGLSYYRSYLYRFTWWADVMRSALGIDAYRKPFFKKTGYFPMYVQVPGEEGGGFGDLSSRVRSRDTVPLMAILARQAKNPHWQWYVEAHGGARPEGGFIGFLRSSSGKVPAQVPTSLPTSKVFRGVGIAAMNSNLLDARKNVRVLFKSSPFGSQSHGYEAQNAFLLNGFGERLLIRSGERDIHGSEFHRLWMWQTKSVNSLTFEHWSQIPHSAESKGKIVRFLDRPELSYVCGEASKAYGKQRVKRFFRHLVYLKGKALLVWDQVELTRPRRLSFHLHSPAPFKSVEEGHTYEVSRKRAACRIYFLWQRAPYIRITDKFDVQPRPYLKLRQWHLTAETKFRSESFDILTLCVVRERKKKATERPKLIETSFGKKLQLTTDNGSWDIELYSLEAEAKEILRVLKKDNQGKEKQLLEVRRF